MCLYCGEHIGKIWYVQEENHTAAGPLVRLVDRIMYSGIIRPGLQSIKKRQPYGTERWTGVTRALWDAITRSLHGFQVLPDLDSALAVVDKANEVVLSTCACREVLSPDQPQAWKCIGLNMAAKVTMNHEAQPWRAISKVEAKEIIAEQRQQGCFQSVGWRLGPQVNWLCNCDQHCGAHRAPELEWGLIPSFFVSHLVKPDSCDSCRECAEWCLRPGALSFASDGRVRIEEALCRGCGLCIEHCPTGALGYAPRRVIYDVAAGKKVVLPTEAVRV